MTAKTERDVMMGVSEKKKLLQLCCRRRKAVYVWWGGVGGVIVDFDYNISTEEERALFDYMMTR